LHAVGGGTLGATGWPAPPRPRASSVSSDAGPSTDDEPVDLVVVGAHLSGMPLNGDLRRLGARFVRAARTTPGYRLSALAGPPPARPGLWRDATGERAIDDEVWRLSSAAFGRVVAAVPPPLCIGTVLLDDGASAKGFLVEAAGLEGATDITGYGGWRRYMARDGSSPGLANAERH
ncbi:MAG: allophanate hydrolase, partial [Hyphomicrobiales bacterium]|nr:allophanate hydrolase [Hyphomicrobiales bacterium]